jgi:hypothetical protein
VAKRFRVERFRGVNSNSPVPQPDELVLARNVLLNYPGRAKTRLGMRRVFHTRTANADIQGIYEFRTNAGSLLRLMKCNGTLSTFDLAHTTTTLEASMSTDGCADFRAYDGLVYVADQKAGNKITTGVTGADNTQQLRRAAPSTALSPTEAGAVSGFGIGTVRVAYSLYNSSLNDESPPRAYESVTKVNANLGIQITIPSDPGSGYSLRIYRTKLGENGPFYRVATSTNYAGTDTLSVLDADLGLSSYPQSTIHNTDGEITAAVPDAAKFVEVHKQSVILANIANSKPLRVLASKVQDPSNFSVTTIAQSPTYYKDVTEGQGQQITGMNVFNGALHVFKDYAIVVRNGDVDASTWQWYVGHDGVGCIAPWSRAVAPGIGIFFASAYGVYLWDGVRCRNLSDNPADGRGIGVEYRGLDFTQVEEWVGCWDEQNRCYLLAVTPSGETKPTRIYAYFYDTDSWADRWEFGMGLIGVTSMSVVTNSSSVPTVFIGTSTGYVYELNYSTLTDGPISGTVTGTAAAGSSTTAIVSTGFYDTGDDLTGLVATVRTVTGSTATYESKLISSNTSTTLTTAAFSADPTGKTFWVGAVRSSLALAGYDGEDPAAEKRWSKISGSWSKQSHTTPVRLGFTLNDDSLPTYAGTEQTMGDVRFSVDVNDRAVECGLYADVIGTSAPLELKAVEYEWSPMETRNPAS